MRIRILTPSELLFEGEAESVTLPGTVGSFTVLDLSSGNTLFM